MKETFTKTQWQVIVMAVFVATLFWGIEYTGNYLESWIQGHEWEEGVDPYNPSDYALSLMVTFLCLVFAGIAAVFPKAFE